MTTNANAGPGPRPPSKPLPDHLQGVIKKMRADFERVAERRRTTQEWSQEDEREIGLAIKASIDASDPDTILGWALWLADISSAMAAWDLIVRGSIARMREQARQQREGQS